MVKVEQWADLRRLHFAEGVSIRELQRRTGLGRNTVRRALRNSEPPRYERKVTDSKLDPFKAEICHLLTRDPRLPGTRILETIFELGYQGSKTILYDHLREIRPLYVPTRSFQRTAYRPGEICQIDLMHLREEVPVGHGQTRKGYLVVACLDYSRAGAACLIFSRRAPDILAGIWHCLQELGALPRKLVTGREASLHAFEGRPTAEFAAFCGELGLAWHFCEPADPQAKGLIERLIGYIRTSFEPGRRYANHLDFQDQLDRWFTERANRRLHRRLWRRPSEALAEETEAMRSVPARAPDTRDRRVIRIGADPYLRLDTNDYSLNRAFTGHRVEILACRQRVEARVLGGGEIAASHRRSYARHLTIDDPAHVRVPERAKEAVGAGSEVEIRPLSAYDALVSA